MAGEEDSLPPAAQNSVNIFIPAGHARLHMPSHVTRWPVPLIGAWSLGVFFRRFHVFFFKIYLSIFFSLFDAITAFTLAVSADVSFRHFLSHYFLLLTKKFAAGFRLLITT
jgi:hypothetical protein